MKGVEGWGKDRSTLFVCAGVVVNAGRFSCRRTLHMVIATSNGGGTNSWRCDGTCRAPQTRVNSWRCSKTMIESACTCGARYERKGRLREVHKTTEGESFNQRLRKESVRAIFGLLRGTHGASMLPYTQRSSTTHAPVDCVMDRGGYRQAFRSFALA